MGNTFFPCGHLIRKRYGLLAWWNRPPQPLYHRMPGKQAPVRGLHADSPGRRANRFAIDNYNRSAR